ncbi:MAG TPA: NADP-dependent oxidoreductase [Solirubrobacteraceae bacterium]
MTDAVAREFHLASRPQGWPTAETFALVETPVPELDDGQVLVRNRFLSVDPYMRGRMNAGRSYATPYEVGQVMHGGAVGEIVESRSDALAVGDTVLHQHGWRDLAVGDARGFRRVDAAGVPASAYLGVLGMPGITAWVGMVDIAEQREGDVVFVSGAAGAVGGTAGQIARLRGATRVIGSAGSPEKAAFARDELGFDTVLSYREGPIAEQLREAAPDGIDVYFDNVGGDHLEAALGAMRDFGRTAACGAISMYNATEAAPGPRTIGLVVPRRLRIRGFIVSDHADRWPAAMTELAGWVREGRLRFRETFVDGLENMPEAFLGLLRGDNTGKMVVRLGD